MTSIIHDFPDIRRRMLGELKAEVKPVEKEKPKVLTLIGHQTLGTGVYSPVDVLPVSPKGLIP